MTVRIEEEDHREVESVEAIVTGIVRKSDATSAEVLVTNKEIVHEKRAVASVEVEAEIDHTATPEAEIVTMI